MGFLAWRRLQPRLPVSFTPGERAKGDGEATTTTTCGTSGDEAPGISLYRDDAGEIFHTYSTYGRGVEVMMGTYQPIDLAPKGRR